MEIINVFAVGRYIRRFSHAGATANGESLYELEAYGQLQPGDIDGDGDVDLNDFALLADCLTGPMVEVISGCHDADLDRNIHVDLRDFAKLQAAFNRGQ